MIKMKKVSILFVVVVFLITSCEYGKKYEREERQVIENYLSSIGDTVYTIKPSGLYFLSIVEGTGRTPVNGDTVSIYYTAKLLSGTLFDTNRGLDYPFTFVVGSGSVISGVDEGVRYMKDGGRAKLITPSSLAYGSSGLYGYNSYGMPYTIISGYTPILWDIEIDTVIVGPAGK